MNQKRIAAVAVLAAASAVTSVIAVKTGVDPPPANIAGAFDPGAGHCGKTAESNRRSVLLRYFRSFSLFCGEAEEPVRIFTDHTVR